MIKNHVAKQTMPRVAPWILEERRRETELPTYDNSEEDDDYDDDESGKLGQHLKVTLQTMEFPHRGNAGAPLQATPT